MLVILPSVNGTVVEFRVFMSTSQLKGNIMNLLMKILLPAVALAALVATQRQQRRGMSVIIPLIIIALCRTPMRMGRLVLRSVQVYADEGGFGRANDANIRDQLEAQYYLRYVWKVMLAGDKAQANWRTK